MAVMELWRRRDLEGAVKTEYVDGNFFTQDSVGNRVGVKVYKDGAEVALTGSVTGYCVLPSGETVSVAGTRSGNQASILVPQSALAYTGPLGITLKLVDGNTITTLMSIIVVVYRSKTDTVITPSSQIITDWSNQISAALQEVEDASAAQDVKIADLKGTLVIDVVTPSITWDADSTDKYINAGGGIGSSAGFHYTNLIDAIPSQGVFSWAYSGTNVAIRVHGYNANGSWVRQLGFVSGVTSDGSIEFAIDKDIKYIRISCPTSATNLQLQLTTYVKDAILDLQNLQPIVEGTDEIVFDIPSMLSINGVMGTDGTWGGITGANAGLYTTKYIAGNQVGNTVTVTAGSNDARIGFLKSVPIGVTDGDTIDFCKQESAIVSQTANTTKTYTVPQDCVCIVFGDKYYTTSRRPSAIICMALPIITRIKQAVTGGSENYDYKLLFWGDSLTAGAGGSGVLYPTVCANELGIEKYKVRGYGGESANAIAIRQGGDLLIIPSGAVNGTYENLRDSFGTNIGFRSDLNETIIINNVECNIVKSNNSLVISGYTGGNSAMQLYGRFATGDENGEIVVIWVGQNGAACAGLTGIDARIAVIDSMISHIGHERYVVIGQSYGTTATNTGDDNKLLAKYGSKFMPVRTLLVQYGLAINNLTPTSQDTADIAAGKVPVSLLSDEVHLNSYGYTAVGKLLADQIRALGYLN